jgi:hypothetical protein
VQQAAGEQGRIGIEAAGVGGAIGEHRDCLPDSGDARMAVETGRMR